MKKIQLILTLSVFIIPIFVLGILSLTLQSSGVSVSENRTLKTMPPLFSNGWMNPEFTKEFEEYYNDHFPFRDYLLLANRKLNSLYYITGGDGTLMVDSKLDMGLGIGKSGVSGTTPLNGSTKESSDSSSTSGGDKPLKPVLNQEEAETGLIIKSNSAMEMFSLSEDLTKYFAETLNYFKKQMPSKKIYILVPPSASEFYAPESYRTPGTSQEKAFQLLRSFLNGVIYVDAYSKLKEHQSEYIFFRTDHHWTARGAYYAYLAYAEKAGVLPVSLNNFKAGQMKGFLGTMYKAVLKYPQSEGMKKDPDTIEYFVPPYTAELMEYADPDMKNGYPKTLIDLDAEKSATKYNVFLGGDSAILKIVTNANNGKKIVVVRDSYGNAFLPYLAANYEEIIAIDPRYFNIEGYADLKLAEFVEKSGADEVLFLNYSMFISGGYWFQWVDALTLMQ